MSEFQPATNDTVMGVVPPSEMIGADMEERTGYSWRRRLAAAALGVGVSAASLAGCSSKTEAISDVPQPAPSSASLAPTPSLQETAAPEQTFDSGHLSLKCNRSYISAAVDGRYSFKIRQFSVHGLHPDYIKEHGDFSGDGIFAFARATTQKGMLFSVVPGVEGEVSLELPDFALNPSMVVDVGLMNYSGTPKDKIPPVAEMEEMFGKNGPTPYSQNRYKDLASVCTTYTVAELAAN